MRQHLACMNIVFTNEIAVVASTLGIDSHEVMRIFTEDQRLNISKAYLRPGLQLWRLMLAEGFARARVFGAGLGYLAKVINHILDSNKMLTDRALDWILAHSKKRVAFSGDQFQTWNG